MLDIMSKTGKMRESKKYTHMLAGKRISCRLCPNNCVILDGDFGLCKTRRNIDGKLYSTVYGYPCSINIDPIEKKPLYHFFPGQKILSLGTFGCNFFCKGCQNFDISRHDTKNGINALQYISPQEIVELAAKNGTNMIAYTYNEPTIFFEYMIDIAKLAKKRGIKNVIVSNGYINPEPLKELCKYIDVANIDLKGITEEFYRKYCGGKLKPVLATIKYIHDKGIWLELTNLLITGFNDDEKDVSALCDWIIKNVGKDVPLHFSRFYPCYHASEIPPTSESSLRSAEKIALSKGIKYVYIGNLGFLENTRCHKCSAILIERSYERSNIKNMNKKDDKNFCSRCGAPISGLF